MKGKGAEKAVLNTLKYRLSEKQALSLYRSICRFLVSKDQESYTKMLRLKYALLQDDVDSYICDYLVMASLLKLMELKYPLILSALTSLTLHQS
ncbi:hypothetical protein [Pontibacter ruber]|uniref:Uncharacterized protein n=1 Tax=Pontibacter ruber TaxID=1343895 RepID=A0ABW5D1S3_9BACT|nr:hypothetical protein [Pontibacter ruber]